MQNSDKLLRDWRIHRAGNFIGREFSVDIEMEGHPRGNGLHFFCIDMANGGNQGIGLVGGFERVPTRGHELGNGPACCANRKLFVQHCLDRFELRIVHFRPALFASGEEKKSCNETEKTGFQ